MEHVGAPFPTDRRARVTVTVGRRQVLGYRTVVHGLLRDTKDPVRLDVLDLGVQDTNVSSARLALAARLSGSYGDPLADPDFTLLWSFRGAPHLHRTKDLPALASHLWPISDADAIARLAAERKPLKAAGIGGSEAFTTASRAMRAVVRTSMPKGELSAAMTERLPEAYSYQCRSCQTTHVYGGLFQLVGPFAGVRLVPDQASTTVAPLTDRGEIPPPVTGPDQLIRAYLRLHGPATLSEAASYLGTSPAAIRAAWPDDLAEVQVDGRTAWLPPGQLDLLRNPPPAADVVRLLPPSDPYLQARDRDLLVPDKTRQKAVWRILANPGAIVVDGEVVGLWRAKRAGRSRLDITLQPFAELAGDRRTALEEEAEVVAAVRGASDVRVRYEDAR
ncbi:MAG: winged helix DNA-binding domain-containing protein [Acidothermales bacterium]|nr:winged helix DNA-binding domain-containing protein [Acidothermales bacterium]